MFVCPALFSMEYTNGSKISWKKKGSSYEKPILVNWNNCKINDSNRIVIHELSNTLYPWAKYFIVLCSSLLIWKWVPAKCAGAALSLSSCHVLDVLMGREVQKLRECLYLLMVKLALINHMTFAYKCWL